MTEKASWVTAKPEEIRAKIIELAKKGTPPERIGLILRDENGLPKARLLGIKISKVLKEAKLWKDHEKGRMESRIEVLAKHSLKNKHDHKSKRSLVRKTARINILKRESQK